MLYAISWKKQLTHQKKSLMAGRGKLKCITLNKLPPLAHPPLHMWMCDNILSMVPFLHIYEHNKIGLFHLKL